MAQNAGDGKTSTDLSYERITAQLTITNHYPSPLSPTKLTNIQNVSAFHAMGDLSE